MLMLSFYTLLIIPMTPIATRILGSLRFHHALYLGVSIQLVASWLRMTSVISWSFPVLFLTHILAQTPFAMFINSISLFVNTWFGENEKGKVTAYCSFAFNGGIMVAYAIPGIVTIGMDTESILECQIKIKKTLLI